MHESKRGNPRHPHGGSTAGRLQASLHRQPGGGLTVLLLLPWTALADLVDGYARVAAWLGRPADGDAADGHVARCDPSSLPHWLPAAACRATPAAVVVLIGCKLLFKARLAFVLLRLRALGRPSALDHGRPPAPPASRVLFAASAIALWAAIAAADASLLPSGLSLLDALGTGSPLWPDGTRFVNGTLVGDGLGGSEAQASVSQQWSQAFGGVGAAPPMPPDASFSHHATPGRYWLDEWLHSDGAVLALSTAPVATLAVAGCTLALGVGDSAFGGAVAAVATLFLLAALSALHFGPLRVSTPDLALLDSVHLPPRWAELPLARVLEAALLAVQLPVLAAAAATALCAVPPRTSLHGPHADGHGDDLAASGRRGAPPVEGEMASRGSEPGAMPRDTASSPSLAADGTGGSHAWAAPYREEAPLPIRLPSGLGAPSPGWRLDAPFTGAPLASPSAAGPSAGSGHGARPSAAEDGTAARARRTGGVDSGEGSPSLLSFSLPLESRPRPNSVRGTRRKDVPAIIPEEGTLREHQPDSRSASRPGSRPESRRRSGPGSRSTTPRRAESPHPGSPRAGASPTRGGVATGRPIPSPRRTESSQPRSVPSATGGSSRPLQGPTADKVRSRDRSPRQATPSSIVPLDKARKPSPRRSEYSDRIIKQISERQQRALPLQVGRPGDGWQPPAGELAPIGLGGAPATATDGGCTSASSHRHAPESLL